MAAADLPKVHSTNCSGWTSPSSSRFRPRTHMTSVLPAPGPAMTRRAPSRCPTTSSCRRSSSGYRCSIMGWIMLISLMSVWVRMDVG